MTLFCFITCIFIPVSLILTELYVGGMPINM